MKLKKQSYIFDDDIFDEHAFQFESFFREDSPEFFRAEWMGPIGTAREHRVMALLWMWAMVGDP